MGNERLTFTLSNCGCRVQIKNCGVESWIGVNLDISVHSETFIQNKIKKPNFSKKQFKCSNGKSILKIKSDFGSFKFLDLLDWIVFEF